MEKFKYLIRHFKDLATRIIVGTLYKFTFKTELRLKTLNHRLDSFIDNSLVRVSLPPVQLVIKKEGIGEQKKLHIIGNSHAHTFTGSELGKYALGNIQKTFWDSYSLGPMSAIDLNTTKKTLLLKLIEKYKFKENDYILIPLGEAECRWYALKDKILPVEPTKIELDKILMPFVNASFEIYFNLIDLGFQPIIWGGHASSRLGPRLDRDIPISGETEIRNRLSKIWEEKMKQFAIDNDLIFVSILPLMLDNNLNTRENFLTDACHLKTDLLEGFLLSEFQNKNINLNI